MKRFLKLQLVFVLFFTVGMLLSPNGETVGFVLGVSLIFGGAISSIFLFGLGQSARQNNSVLYVVIFLGLVIYLGHFAARQAGALAASAFPSLTVPISQMMEINYLNVLVVGTYWLILPYALAKLTRGVINAP